MLDGLQTEIDNHTDLAGASPRIVVEKLNVPGSALIEAWVTNPEPVLKSVNDVYTVYVSDASLTRLVDFLALPDNKALALRFDKATHFNLSSPVVVGLLAELKTAGIVTVAEYDALIRLGQVKKSRAEELFGRKLTMEDF